MSEREYPPDWHIQTGFYCEGHYWSGSSTFLAGLNYARLHRSWPFDPMVLPHTVHGILNHDNLDEDGDDQSEEEREFFDRCARAGVRVGLRLRGKTRMGRDAYTREGQRRLDARRESE